MKIDKLKIYPTDDKWVSEQFNHKGEVKRKKVEVSGLAVALELSTDVNTNESAPSESGKEERKDKFLGSSNEGNYIIFPFSFEIRLTLHENDYFDINEKKASTFEILMKNPLMTCLNPHQIHSLLVFTSTLNDLMKIHSNFHLRPPLDISIDGNDQNTTIQWWKYAIQSVINERRESWSFYKAYRKYKLYERYVVFYKRQKKFVRKYPLFCLDNRPLVKKPFL